MIATRALRIWGNELVPTEDCVRGVEEQSAESGDDVS